MTAHEGDDGARIHAAGQKRARRRATEPSRHRGFQQFSILRGDFVFVAFERLRVGQPIPRLDIRLARDRVEHDRAARGHAPHVAIQRGIAGDETVCEELNQTLRRDFESTAVERAEIPHAAPEHEIAVALRVVERLGAEAISHEQQTATGRVPPCKGERAFDVLECLEAAFSERT